MAPSKKVLGVGYLFGAGVALLGSLIGYVWFTQESPLVVAIGTFSAILPFAAIVYIGFMFLHDDLPDSFVWQVAQWFALGLGVSTLFTIAVFVASDIFAIPDLLPSLVIITIAATSVIGALLGLVKAFRSHHRTLRDLYQRNTVMNRVLRHNIRNDMNVILSRAELLADGPDDVAVHAEIIKKKTNEVISLSEAAREIESIHATTEPEPIDAVSVIECYVERARDMYPQADIDCDVPGSAMVAVDELFQSVLDTLVENAIEYNDSDEPKIQITVESTSVEERWVEVRITDNGPGIPTSQSEVLFREGEEATHHGEGLGLWLVKWFVDQHDGDLWFEANDPDGTTVCLRLPPGTSAGA